MVDRNIKAKVSKIVEDAIPHVLKIRDDLEYIEMYGNLRKRKEKRLTREEYAKRVHELKSWAIIAAVAERVIKDKKAMKEYDILFKAIVKELEERKEQSSEKKIDNK